MKTKICIKCGEELKQSANFCWNCGIPIREIEKEEFSVNADDLVKTVKKLIHQGKMLKLNLPRNGLNL